MPTENKDLETRLAKIEIMLLEILERLEKLEETLTKEGGEETRKTIETLTRLTTIYSLPIAKALEAARTLARLISTPTPIELDELDITIIEAIAAGHGESLRELETAVRKARGRASRRVIRERITKLVKAGIVKAEYDGRRLKLALASEE